MNGLARFMIFAGLLLVAAGAVLLLLARAGLPPGSLPGDVAYRGRRVQVYFPLGTSVLLSLLFSLLLYFIGRWRR